VASERRLAHDDPAGRKIAIAFSKISTVLRTEAWKGAWASGLTPTQGQILVHLLQEGGRASTPGDIAEALAVTPPTVSDALHALEEKGLITKRPNPADARSLRVALTRKGAKEAKAALQWPDLAAEVAGVLTPHEEAVLIRGLLKMIRELQVRGRIPVQRMCVDCRFFRPFAHPELPETPHHCAFVDAPFGDRDLRLGCPDHEELPQAQADVIYRRFATPSLVEGIP